MKYGIIRRGAKVSHGTHYGHWPSCQPPDAEYYSGNYKEETKFPDAVFRVVWVEAGDQYYWECTRFGYGLVAECEHNGYGNGSIHAFGIDSVELINDRM